MTLEQDLVPTLGVLAILLGVHFYNALQVRRPPPAPPLTEASLRGRYASHRGSVVGEVVAVANGSILLRQAGTHKAVPLSQARMRDGDLVLEGDIDWAAAEAAGQAWASRLAEGMS